MMEKDEFFDVEEVCSEMSPATSLCVAMVGNRVNAIGNLSLATLIGLTLPEMVKGSVDTSELVFLVSASVAQFISNVPIKKIPRAFGTETLHTYKQVKTFLSGPLALTPESRQIFLKRYTKDLNGKYLMSYCLLQGIFLAFRDANLANEFRKFAVENNKNIVPHF